jgi:hypothetical protein
VVRRFSRVYNTSCGKNLKNQTRNNFQKHTSVIARPSTPSFSSPSNLTASSALFFPTLFNPSRKKLLPTSSFVASEGSRIVKCPIPGRTRFLRIDVEVALAERTRIREFSRAVWPDDAQSLSM